MTDLPARQSALSGERLRHAVRHSTPQGCERPPIGLPLKIPSLKWSSTASAHHSLHDYRLQSCTQPTCPPWLPPPMNRSNDDESSEMVVFEDVLEHMLLQLPNKHFFDSYAIRHLTFTPPTSAQASALHPSPPGPPYFHPPAAAPNASGISACPHLHSFPNPVHHNAKPPTRPLQSRSIPCLRY